MSCTGTGTGTGTCTVAMDQARSVTVQFALDTYTIGGSVDNLTGTGLVPRNGGEELPISGNGGFTFAHPVAHGGSYAVTVHAQPTGQTCTVGNASGRDVAADVNDVRVDCADTTIPITPLAVPVPALSAWSLALLGLLALRRRV